MADIDGHLPAAPAAVRFQWLDGVRGIAVLWIAFFHCILSYNDGRFPQLISSSSFFSFIEQNGGASLAGKFLCTLETITAAVLQRGSQGVGVFLLFSGFGLTYSLVKKREADISWTGWYRRRLLRLFPIFWLAHLVFLVSPFVVLHDPIDYRFLLSFFGDRVYPVDKMFFYLVPAWWFLGLLIELYIVYPLLFKLMQRLGWAAYLGLCIALTAGARIVLLRVLKADGDYIMGAFFACRLWEFATGMALGKLMAEAPDATFRLLLSSKGFLFGVALYCLGAVTYQPNLLFILSDGLTAVGLSVILIHLAYNLDKLPGIGRGLALAGVFSYGIYLFHQPYVMFAGEKLQPYSFGIFLCLASLVIIAISAASMGIEHTVNRSMRRFR